MRILLNTLLRDNYSFFDPDYPLSLSLSNPGANVDKITESMKRGFRGGTIIDVDGATDIEAPEHIKPMQDALLRSMRIERTEKKVETAKPVEPKKEEKTPEEKVEEPKDNKNKNKVNKKKEGEE